MATGTLCRAERLRGEKLISNLFDNGQSFFQMPYRVFWIKIDEQGLYPVRFAVSVPKRRFKGAVKRNLLKRRTREVFRINRQILDKTITVAGHIHLMVIYTSDSLLPYAELEDAMKKILHRIAQKYVESV